MFRNRPVSLVLVGLFLWVTACTSYKQIGVDEVAGQDRVRVTLTNGRRETILNPVVEADTIKGQTDSQRSIRLTFPLARVDQLDAVDRNDFATALLVLGISAGIVFGIAVIGVAASDWGDWPAHLEQSAGHSHTPPLTCSRETCGSGRSSSATSP